MKHITTEYEDHLNTGYYLNTEQVQECNSKMNCNLFGGKILRKKREKCENSVRQEKSIKNLVLDKRAQRAHQR